jgi:single-stranded-DNA-specific exonuclease
MSERLTDAVRHLSEKLRSTVEGGNEVAIISHLDADGITSGSIMAMALRRMGARYSVRAISDMNSSIIEKMKTEGRDYYVITDLGAGWASHLRKTLGDKWVIIDHHEMTEEEVLTPGNLALMEELKWLQGEWPTWWQVHLISRTATCQP